MTKLATIGFVAAALSAGSLQPGSPAALRRHVEFLASDRLQGRGNGTAGMDAAADYIAAQFKDAGLQPAGTDGFFQTAELTLLAPNLQGFRLRFHDATRDIPVAPDEILLLTSAGLDLNNVPTVKIDADDRAAIAALQPEDLDGKVALIKIITKKDGEEHWQNMTRAMKKLLAMHPVFSVNYGPNAAKVELPGIFTLPSESPARAVPQMPIRTPGLRTALETMPSGLTPLRMSFHLAPPIRRQVQCRNIVAMLPGSETGPDARYIVVTANYDGSYERRGEGFLPGANANASAVASLIETARMMAGSNPRPRRSIIFVAYFGEQPAGTLGGLGAKTYLQNPPAPPGKTDACIKLIQLGRGPAHKLAISPVDGSSILQSFVAAGKASSIEVYDDRAHNAAIQGHGFAPLLAASGVPSYTIYAAPDPPDAYTIADAPDKLDYPNMAALQKTIAAGLFALADSQSSSAKSPFEGTWIIESPLVPRPLEATFHVTGEEVTGTMKLGDGTVVPISAGSVWDADISFRFRGLNGRTLIGKGSLKGDIIEFEILLPGNQYGSPYTAKRKQN